MCSTGETKATDLASLEDWMAVATAPEVDPYTTMSYISGAMVVCRYFRSGRVPNAAIDENN